MGSSFLTLTNSVLGRLNEVRLNETTFGTARGFHAMVKEAVNSAIRDINHSEGQWPFNFARGEAETLPLVANYALPDNVGVVDWDSFYLEKSDRNQASNLPYIEYPIYLQKRKSVDDNSGTGAIPLAVYRTDGNEFGVTPWPDDNYVISYGYWVQPLDLLNHDDTTTIPEQWDYVIVDRAMFYALTFRQDLQTAAQYRDYFKDHIKDMRRMLIRAPSKFTDTRTHRPIGRTW